MKLNALEKFLLAFMKGVVAAAPAIAPIFIHSDHGVAIFNASEALTAAVVEQFTPMIGTNANVAASATNAK